MPRYAYPLADWADIEEDFDSPALLVGNGASQAVSTKFGYGSLHKKACHLERGMLLDHLDQVLFDRLGNGTDFELVLHQLANAMYVAEVLGHPFDQILVRYHKIRGALLDAVAEVHVTYQDVTIRALEDMSRHLSSYKQIYSLNYDFLIYWAYMRHENNFTDHFEDGVFIEDFGDWRNNRGRTKVLYLHGALHLYRDFTGEVMKLQRYKDTDLLNVLLESRDDTSHVPLFVSEGSGSEKRAKIRSSPYLSFCIRKFEEWDGPLVVFGCSLGKEDAHLSSILKRKKGRIAVSIYPEDEDGANARMLYYRDLLKPVRDQLVFFRSRSHPFGLPELAVKSAEQ